MSRAGVLLLLAFAAFAAGSACTPPTEPPRAPVVEVSVTAVSAADGGSSAAAAHAEDGAWHDDDRVDVEWHGGWYPAVVLHAAEGGWLVHYEGYGEDWDEVVDAERIRPRDVEVVGEPPEDDMPEPDP